ncbi:hypothetical protein C7418_5308 [Cupriavidus plantarum]|nr:hypothetical protein C7418_5308 [Cupriavidus plantarum]
MQRPSFNWSCMKFIDHTAFTDADTAKGSSLTHKSLRGVMRRLSSSSR